MAAAMSQQLTQEPAAQTWCWLAMLSEPCSCPGWLCSTPLQPCGIWGACLIEVWSIDSLTLLRVQKSCFISATWPPKLRVKESEHVSAKQNLPQGSLLTIWIPGAKQMQSLWPSIWKVYFSLLIVYSQTLIRGRGSPSVSPLGPTFEYLS